MDSAKAVYLGQTTIECVTEEGWEFKARATGTHFKNFRSSPLTAIGTWIKYRCQAQPGDEVHARWWDDRPGGVLGLRYVRKYALPEKDGANVEVRRLERETEDALAARLTAQGVPVMRQVRVPTGIIDVLTPDTLYEVKTWLTRDSVFEGLGQLLVYQAGRGEGAALRLCLYGRETRETAPMVPVLAGIGVEVELWTE